ncbi:aminopeptidase P family protein [Aristophania vespae]|uniref:aminopeptidase P family protein n=1 Tax=Aristophania vespae TaxID=2697033 RepID=UPI0023510754|nr:aminopeptidase P family protein [Aristophania vespae]UMM63180.1 hypothetical protein DM15PD_01360 [Aristophania vespae]
MQDAALSHSERLEKTRKSLKQLGVSGFIITRGDEYLGEYVAPYAERLAWLTGFTGSAGLAILLEDKGCVFSDGRYTVQLEQQVDHHLWERRHISLSPPKDWLKKEACGLKIGFDPRLVSKAQYESWLCQEIELVPLQENPIDMAWSDQPKPPQNPIQPHPLVFSGESSLSKREKLADALKEAGQDAMILADGTSLAWLLNIRGSDIPMTPIAHGYGIFYADNTVDFFVEPTRITQKLDEDIRVFPPSELRAKLTELNGHIVRIDPSTTPFWFSLELTNANIVYLPDLCTLPKSIKNSVEQRGSRNAHLEDGVAIVRFLHWLEHSGIGKTETELAEKLHEFRSQSEHFKEESFETISAVGSNGAYPHYRAVKGQDKVLTPNNVYLFDSGGQYPFGTTDITRTIWLGPDDPPDSLRDAYTRVLKGNIAVTQARFPQNLPGYRLDSLARYALWQAGLDYDHGTGHGIGSYLSVHEGPQSISPAPRTIGLQPGMIISNEPGYYAEGQYGIRIENLLLVKETFSSEVKNNFLEFEVLTFAPIDGKLIDVKLLSQQELAWLNGYHSQVRKTLLPLLEKELHPWLIRNCAPLY